MIYLRKAETSDMELLFEWANDPLVRENSFNTARISYNDHVKWFTGIMKDPSVLQFILMEDAAPIGQIRLNVDKGTAEIGYSIAQNYRGRGYGRKILQLLAEIVRSDHPEIYELVAKVKPENKISRELFVSEGYEPKYLCYSLYTKADDIID